MVRGEAKGRWMGSGERKWERVEKRKGSEEIEEEREGEDVEREQDVEDDKF